MYSFFVFRFIVKVSPRPGVSKTTDEGEGPSPKDIRDEREERHSIYDNVPLVICNKIYHEYQSEATDVGSYFFLPLPNDL